MVFRVKQKMGPLYTKDCLTTWQIIAFTLKICNKKPSIHLEHKKIVFHTFGIQRIASPHGQNLVFHPFGIQKKKQKTFNFQFYNFGL